MSLNAERQDCELKIGANSGCGAYSTLLKRISLPMNCANSFGLISLRRRTGVAPVSIHTRTALRRCLENSSQRQAGRGVLLIHRHDEPFHDVILPLGRVLARVEGEDT